MQNVLKVIGIDIPKIRNKYFTGLRSVKFELENEYWAVECFTGGTDIKVGDNVKVSVQNMNACTPDSLWEDAWINHYPGYLCVSACADGPDEYNLYEFHRAEETETDTPYSVIFGRSKEQFNVGESYVFCYRQIR